MIIDKYKIRRENESLILNAVIEHVSISRANISKVTGLNKASVSEIVKKLLDDNLIIETGIGTSQSQGGRKPILLRFNERGSVVAAVDLGSDYIYVALTYLDGTFIFNEYIENINVDKESAFELICNILDPQLKDIEVSVVGLCVAIHGAVLDNKIIYTPQYDLYEGRLLEELSNYYDFPVYFQNEANLSALGEYVFGSKIEHLVSLSIHSGIGAGFISNGHIRVGTSGQAGEVGHTILYPGGRQCPCGNKGCIEEYASKRVLYQQVKEILNIDFMDSDHLKILYDSKNEDVVELVENNAKYIAVAINNLIMHYNPESIVINASYFRKIPELVDHVNSYLGSRITEEVTIRNSTLDNNAIILGCIAYAVQVELNITNLKFDL